MADNVELDPGTGGAVIAGDDIGGVIYPRSKVTLGADGANDGDVSGTNPMPVKGTGTAGTANAGVVTVQGIASMTPVQVGDNSTSLTIDAPVAAPVFVRLSDGADPITQLDVNIANMSPNLFSHVEDAASANAHIGVGSMAVRKATPANTSDTDGDYEFLQMSGGRLWVSAVLDTELPAGTQAIGKLAANSGVDIGDVDILSIAAGTNNIGNVGLIPRTSGGLTLYSNIDLDETKVQVKGSAGQVYWMHVMNMSNAPLYLKFWDLLAASVTVGTTAATMVIPIPTQGNTNGAGTQISISQGLAFNTGITIACVTGVGTASSAGPGANELVISLGYA